jgi:hypothetical protein
MVIYDKASLDGDLQYEVISDSINYTSINSGVRYYSIPANLQSQMLVGFADWSADRTNSGLDIEWVEDPTNNRIIIKTANFRLGVYWSINNLRMAFFYIKARTCTNPSLYFNSNFPNIPNCVDICPVYTYPVVATKTCFPCMLGCWTCSGPTACLTCNPDDIRTINNNLCPCDSGYYPDPAGGSACVLCSSQLANCATCTQNPAESFNCLTCE